VSRGFTSTTRVHEIASVFMVGILGQGDRDSEDIPIRIPKVI